MNRTIFTDSDRYRDFRGPSSTRVSTIKRRFLHSTLTSKVAVVADHKQGLYILPQKEDLNDDSLNSTSPIATE